MTEEEIRERDAKCGFGKDHNKVIMGWQAEKDRRWLLRELEQVRKAYENQGLLLAGTAEQLAEVSQQLAEAHRELDRVRKDLVICRKSKSVYDYSDKMSERLKAEVNHLLKEKVKRLEQQLAEAQKDTERLDWKPRSPISINYDPDVDWWLIEDGEGELGAGQALRQALDNARGRDG